MEVVPNPYLVRLAELEASFQPAPVETVNHPILSEAGVTLLIKREDQIHSIISGNKWRKLKYILKHALELNHTHLISMGGPWSNHLHALAFVGQALGIKTTGIIRGEEPANKSSTLQDMDRWGMTLQFVSRAEFRHLRECHAYDSEPASQYKGYWIPEGGASRLAMQGVTELVADLNQTDFDTIALACGTGTTFAGIVSALSSVGRENEVLGIAALKGAGFLYDDISQLLATDRDNWSVNLDYHFGGFAKVEQRLLDFIDEFELKTEIQLEPIYTGKLFFALLDLINEGHFSKGHTILAIHTGGLQGRAGYQL